MTRVRESMDFERNQIEEIIWDVVTWDEHFLEVFQRFLPSLPGFLFMTWERVIRSSLSFVVAFIKSRKSFLPWIVTGKARPRGS